MRTPWWPWCPERIAMEKAVQKEVETDGRTEGAFSFWNIGIVWKGQKLILLVYKMINSTLNQS